MPLEQHVFLRPGQSVTVYGELAPTDGRRPAKGLVVADSITIHAVSPAPKLKLRRLSFRV